MAYLDMGKNYDEFHTIHIHVKWTLGVIGRITKQVIKFV